MSDRGARRPARRALTLAAVDAGAVVGATGDFSGAANATPRALLDIVRRLRARERGHLASLLHDGPIQELAALALELGEVRRPAGAPPGNELSGLAPQVHAAGRTLCRLQDELWPFPRPGSGLVETLKQRTGWLLAAPLAVAPGEGAAGLSESDVQVVADVTELILVGLGDAEAWDRPIVAIRADPVLIVLELNMTPTPGHDPAASGSIAAAGGTVAVVAWLHRLAAAIQARADIGLDDRRLRISMEIPRCPSHRRDARAGALGAVGLRGPDVQVADNSFVGLLEGAPDAMVCVDRHGRIALVNAQTERLFGYRRDELVGQPVEILVPEMAREAHRGHRDRYTADPRLRTMGSGMELSARRRDGSTFPTEISLSAIDTDDGLLVIAAVRDVTERLELRAERERLRSQAERDKLERQLQQSRRLESLGQLAGGVAHDFNNLLAVISNYAAFVCDEVAKDGGQADLRSVREDVRQIQLAAGRAAELTHQLLAFARRDVVRPRPLDLNEVITRVEQLLIRTLGEHVILKTGLAGQLCAVLADPGQIEQVLVNLAVNARDAMPYGGTLAVQTSLADIDESHAASRSGLPPGQYACLKVSDTGVGMPREVIDHAFEPFFTTRPKGKGTGLGLATVYGIVTQAGGYVQIYSELGLGTTITILLPATGERLQPGPAPEQGPGGGAGETVLIVEDEPAMREVTRRILCRSGYNVITAASGPEAIEIAASHTGDIDVLLTDVVMPRMLGKEAAERIRALRPGVRVLFMSGYTQGVLDAQGVVEEGVNLIQKPFSEAQLLAALGQLIASATPH